MSADGGAKKIFISHASNDPDWPETAVRALATKLRQRSANVLLDYWHEDVIGNKLPLAEWRLWMRQCLDEADHVLCLCSDRYAKLANREDNREPAGRGVAYEAFEIEKRLYNQKQHNQDWCWVLRLDTAVPNLVVPHFMQERCPEYGTPLEESRLVREIVGKVASLVLDVVELCDASPPMVSPLPRQDDGLAEQCKLVCNRLKDATPFWNALRYYEWETRQVVLDGHDAFVQWLAGASPECARDAMFATRCALEQCVDGDECAHRLSELAAVSVYCLAVCRLVNVQALGRPYRFPKLASEAAHLYCAVLATVLCGGRLELATSGTSRLPRPAYAYDIRIPGAGDRGPQVFERAVYQVLLADRPDAPDVALEDAPLTSMQLARIEERIQTIRRKRRHSLTLVLHDELQQDSADAFSQKNDVPVFVCDPGVANALIGFSAERLAANIEEMWSELRFCNSPAAITRLPDHTQTPKPA